MAANSTPDGCGELVTSLYYNLCDLGAVWGIVVEAVAAVGVVFSVVLFITLLASLPFIKDGTRRSSVALHAVLLVATAGLFLLTFTFIVGEDVSTCVSRRFLFGVLFAACFSCLLMKSVSLNVLARRNQAPPAWALCVGALALWLVEVIINTEWLVITAARRPPDPLNATARPTPCNVAKRDFVMALIYVMTLLLATLLASLAAMMGGNSKWRKDGAWIFLTSLVTLSIWVVWIVMYVSGNQRTGGPTWDNPTLAIALVSNGWTFILLHAIPDICCHSGDAERDVGQDLYLDRGIGYETILKEQSPHHVFMDNKAFRMDENHQTSKPVSPYSGYSGRPRSSVYQPTELALITTATRQEESPFDMIIPRASAGSAHNGRSTPSTHAEGGSIMHTQPSVGQHPPPFP